jgi:hypothetical protein
MGAAWPDLVGIEVGSGTGGSHIDPGGALRLFQLGCTGRRLAHFDASRMTTVLNIIAPETSCSEFAVPLLVRHLTC